MKNSLIYFYFRKHSLIKRKKYIKPKRNVIFRALIWTIMNILIVLIPVLLILFANIQLESIYSKEFEIEDVSIFSFSFSLLVLGLTSDFVIKDKSYPDKTIFHTISFVVLPPLIAAINLIHFTIIWFYSDHVILHNVIGTASLTVLISIMILYYYKFVKLK